MVVWSASRIDIANYCRMRYYLRYVEKEKPLRLSVYAKGSLLHNLIENFWEKLGTKEEVAKKSSKKKYSNEKEFASYAKGQWMRTLVASQKSENPIYWAYENEPWIIRSKLGELCQSLFYNLFKEGKPLFKGERKFDFTLLGKRFTGRIDDIRIKDEKVIIRDYKSGKPWMGEMKLNNDPQLTLYNVGLCSLCANDSGLARKLNLTEERKKFMGNPIYINPDFIQEFYMIEGVLLDYKGNSRKIIYQSKRRDEHFFELLKMIEGIEKAINKGEIYPERGRKCDYCDLKYACEKKLDDVGAGKLADKKGQQFFSFVFPDYIKENEENIKQKKIRYKWK